MEDCKKYDVIILGGGLAGLTLALQLKKGNPDLSIQILERRTDQAPIAVHKVGESTSELGSYYLREVAGLKDYLTEHQLRKMGFRFFFSPEHRDDISRRVEIGSKFITPFPTHQIDRGLMENELVRKSEADGIEVVLGAKVTSVDLSKSCQKVTYTYGAIERTTTGTWVVDASGRSAVLKRKLGLEQAMNHLINAAWFRLDSAIDLDDWSDNQDWRQYMEPGRRRLATNHLMGEGYWVWIIPLVSGSTSIGIVADPAYHPFDTFNTFDKAFQWLEKHEPNAAKMLEPHRAERMDFKLMKHFAYDCKRFYSGDRWAITGEAGAFLDPFYSPGSDFIALGNSWTADLILRDLAGEDITQRALIYNFAHKELLSGWSLLYKDLYDIFGKTQVMLMKIAWDWATYWAVPNVLYMNEGYTNLAVLKQYSASNNSIGRRFAHLNERMQGLFRQWGKYEVAPCADRQLNVFDLGFLLKFQTELHRRYNPEALMAKVESNVHILEKIAAEIFRLASAQVKCTPLDMKVDPFQMTLEDDASELLRKSGCAGALPVDDSIQADLAQLWFSPDQKPELRSTSEVATNMEYIQQTFLNIQEHLQQDYDLEALMAYLDKEPPKFRSIAYESASMQIAMKALMVHHNLEQWHTFFHRANQAHLFHMGIGLGWAFAKAEISPAPFLDSLVPWVKIMIYDGMGYFHGLFKARKSIKNQEIPPGIHGNALKGFDQGLGRRLWYNTRGEVSALAELIHTFPAARRADLWRGVGIACGYVGGLKEKELIKLRSFSAEFIKQLGLGVSLAAMCRSASGSITTDIDLTYHVVCHKDLTEVEVLQHTSPETFYREQTETLVL
jgi:flavin-dependent dehydrogenase